MQPVLQYYAVVACAIYLYGSLLTLDAGGRGWVGFAPVHLPFSAETMFS